MLTRRLIAFSIFTAILAFAGIFLYRWNSIVWIASPQVSILPAIRPIPPAIPPKKPAKPPVIEPDWPTLSRQLTGGSPYQQMQLVQQLDNLAKHSPYTLSRGLNQWLPALMQLKRYGSVERLAQIAIIGKAQDLAIVEAAQRGRIDAFLAQHDFVHAQREAKSLFNVIDLSETPSALDLFAKAARLPKSADAQAALQATVVHSTAFNAQIEKLDSQEPPEITALLQRGNLLLLSDRPIEARSCFESACRLAAGQDSAALRDAVNGLARSFRAQFESAEKANALILALRRRQPADDHAQLGDPALLSVAAAGISLAPVGVVPSLPPAEIAREGAESQTPSNTIRIETGFECSTPLEIHELSPTHFQLLLETPGFRDWFMFRVIGAAGKTVRFDLQDPDGNLGKWRTLDPVYACVDRLNAPSAFAFQSSRSSNSPAFNGPLLPDTQNQNWHFIPDTWTSDPNTLSFTQRFDANIAYVAMRIPYPPSFNEAYLRDLSVRGKITLLTIGRSSLGKPLLMAEIGAANQPSAPCILAYACEHADEPDSAWAAHGMIDFLTSDAPAAKDLRRRFTFLILPVFDPDTAVLGEHERIMTTFRVNHFSTESIAYADWFEHWIDAGNRLDVVLDLHNVQSVESPHVFSPLIEGGAADRAQLALALHLRIMESLDAAGYTVSPRPNMRGLSPDRLGGWLAVRFGPLCLAYEFNSQSPDRHLSLAEITAAGATFPQAIAAFWDSRGPALMANVDSIRQARLARLAIAHPTTQPANAIEAEAWRSARAMGGRDIPPGELIVP